MIEAGLRLGIAAALAGGAIWTRHPDGEWALRIAAVYGALAVFAMLLQRREMLNAQGASFLGILDGLLIAGVAGRLGLGGSLGFLAILPAVWATVHHQAITGLMSPMIACGIVAGWMLGPSTVPLAPVVGQAFGALVIGLLTKAGREIVRVESEIIEVPVPIEREAGDSSGNRSYLTLRESYRSLRDQYNQLLRRCRRDRCAHLLMEAALAKEDTIQQRITAKLREITQVSGVGLYSSAQFDDVMVIRASSGELPVSITQTTVPIRQALSESQLRSQFDLWLRSIRVPEKEAYCRSVVLKDRGMIVGILCLSDNDPEKLQQAYEIAEECASVAALLLRDAADRTRLEMRVREAEMLYQVAAVTMGSDSAVGVASRTVRELWSAMNLDHLGIQFLDGQESFPVANQGAQAALVDSLLFGTKTGLEGWLEAGAPESILFDTSRDDRVAPRAALTKRVGSFALIPIQFESQPFGFLTAATHRAGGIDLGDLQTLRTIASEVASAISRLQGKAATIEGLATPQEFQKAVASATEGCLAHLEPLRRNELMEEFGPVAYERAIVALGQKLRSQLPSGGVLCRRSEGDFVALLPGSDEEYGRRWVNQAAALAGMTAISTPDGRARIPLALRGKSTVLRSQSRQIVTQPGLAEAKT